MVAAKCKSTEDGLALFPVFILSSIKLHFARYTGIYPPPPAMVTSRGQGNPVKVTVGDSSGGSVHSKGLGTNRVIRRKLQSHFTRKAGKVRHKNVP